VPKKVVGKQQFLKLLEKFFQAAMKGALEGLAKMFESKPVKRKKKK
jgi:hypothetical protein